MIEKLQDVVKSPWFVVGFDVLYVVNLVVIHLEVDIGHDYEFEFEIIRHGFCGIYTLEMCLRVLGNCKPFFYDATNLLNLAIVVLAIIDVWIRQEVTWLWRFTLLRAANPLQRIRSFAQDVSALQDLYIVLTGLLRAARSLAWLALAVLILLYACGSALTSLIQAEEEADDACGVPSGDCINQYEHFGTVSRSALTLLQLATFDRWASYVVRPLAHHKPYEAALLSLFVVTVACGVLSVAVGLLVWSTVSLARSHQDHASHQEMMEEKQIIRLQVQFLRASMEIENRRTIDLRLLQDTMSIPQFAKAFRDLDLPVGSINELFQHLDKEGRGEITIIEFEEGVAKMTAPSSRFDVAIMNARLGGAANYVGSLDARTERVLRACTAVRTALREAFMELNEVAKPTGCMGEMPEVRLREAGRIGHVNKFLPPRYTG